MFNISEAACAEAEPIPIIYYKCANLILLSHQEEINAKSVKSLLIYHLKTVLPASLKLGGKPWSRRRLLIVYFLIIILK